MRKVNAELLPRRNAMLTSMEVRAIFGGLTYAGMRKLRRRGVIPAPSIPSKTRPLWAAEIVWAVYDSYIGGIAR